MPIEIGSGSYNDKLGSGSSLAMLNGCSYKAAGVVESERSSGGSVVTASDVAKHTQ